MKKSFSLFCLLTLAFFGFAQQSKLTIWSENFNTENLSAWTLIDGDGDGWNFYTSQLLGPDWQPIGTPFLRSVSFTQFDDIGHVFPDNWAITPAIDLSAVNASELIQLNWTLVGGESSFNPSPNNEKYAIYIAEVNDTTAFIQEGIKFTESDLPYAHTMRSLDISEYAGKVIYIAIRHFDLTDEYEVPFSSSLQIDDMSVTAGFTSFTVLPSFLSQTLNSSEQANQDLVIANTGSGDLRFQAVIDYSGQRALVSDLPVVESFSKYVDFSLEQSGIVKQASAPQRDKSGVMLHHDGPNQGNSIGLTGGGSFYSTVRFPASMLSAYAGYALQSVDVYIGDVPSSLMLKVWGAGTATAPGTLIFEQNITVTGSSWNTISLSQSIDISGGDLWVGFFCTHDEGLYPIGVDNGPALTDGGMLSVDGQDWTSLLGVGLNANFNIRILLDYSGIQWLNVSSGIHVVGQGQELTLNVGFDASGLPGGTYTASIIIIPEGEPEAQVVVPVTLVVNAVYYTLSFDVTDADGQAFPDALIQINGQANQPGIYSFELEMGTYDYQVTKEGYFPLSGEVVIANENQNVNLIMQVDDTSIDIESPDRISIYPNPSSDYLMVGAPFEIMEIRLFNMSGQMQSSVTNCGHSQRIDLAGINPGIYLVQIVTAKSAYTKQIQVIR